MIASMRRDAHSVGTSPWQRNHVVPHGAPHGDGTGRGRRASSDGPGLDAHRHAMGVDERQYPLEQLAIDALLDQQAVVVHRRQR